MVLHAERDQLKFLVTFGRNSPVRAGFTVALLVVTSTTLSTNTDTIANLDAPRNLAADSDCLTYDLVSDTDWVVCWTPA